MNTKSPTITGTLLVDEIGTDAIELEDLPPSWAKEVKKAIASLLGDDRTRIMVYDDSITGRPYLLYALAYNSDVVAEQSGLKPLKFIRIENPSIPNLVNNPEAVEIIAKAFDSDVESVVLVVDSIEAGISLGRAAPTVRIVATTPVALQETFSLVPDTVSAEIITSLNSWHLIDTRDLHFTKKEAELAAMAYLEADFNLAFGIPNLPHTCAEGLWNEIEENHKPLLRKTKRGPIRTEGFPLSLFIDLVRVICADVFLNVNSSSDRTVEEVVKNAVLEQAGDVLSVMDEAGSDSSFKNKPPKNKYTIIEEDSESTQDDYKIEFRNIEQVEQELKGQIFGQDKAIRKIFKGLAVPALGINDENKPLRSMLFLGKTGTGKTETVLQLAKMLATQELNLVRIDMSELSASHEVSKLFGAPPGYAGHEEGGMLTNAVRKNPHSVILLDEIEKAHPKVWDSFLQILDAGRMTDGQGETVDFTGCLIIMTSNIGAAEISKRKTGFSAIPTGLEKNSDNERTVMRCLEEEFKPELINRIDDIVFFDEIAKVVALRVADSKIVEINNKLKEKYRLRIHLSNSLKQHILELGELDKYGARNVVKNTQNVITNALVGPLNDTLRRKRSRLQNVYLTLDGDKKVVKTTKSKFLD